MASRDTDQTSTEKVPFGATERPSESSSKEGSTRRTTRRGGRRRRRRKRPEGEEQVGGERQAEQQSGQSSGETSERGGERPRRERRTRRRRRPAGGEGRERAELGAGSGVLIIEKGNYGTLRDPERMLIPNKKDIYVPQRLIQKHKLRDGSLIEGPIGRGQKHKFQLNAVEKIDGMDPREVKRTKNFRDLTSIDPDFHYATGDITDNGSMRAVDVISPIGRGQRALIVAPPRSGKTTLLREFAAGIEKGYTDVHLFVLLVDERPEEATDWVRSTAGTVFVSTTDETPKNHVQLAEAVWKRCQRLVELGEDVVLIIDSITRLARAYNNHKGTSGKTMSGGLDSRAMERPRQIFGSARNTETAGSLTIVGTTLVDTGSRMDQMIFEEFKGTGNMELVLNRKLADRRIFPAIDIEKSGTRKEEKLFTSQRHRRINTLRRVLLKMNFAEAMELLITKLENVEKTDDFLERFDVDPEA
ncbi:MAG: transcription termination factor Rho [Planctomycetes bacterium]|nr:transcription termination factor Rho [Planctomycetota bacterium]